MEAGNEKKGVETRKRKRKRNLPQAERNRTVWPHLAKFPHSLITTLILAQSETEHIKTNSLPTVFPNAMPDAEWQIIIIPQQLSRC
jgi:hypothetical protein